VSQAHKFVLYNAESVFGAMNYQYHELRFDHLVEIRKRSALEWAEEAEPEPQEWVMKILKLTEGLVLMEDGIQVFEDIDWNEQWAAASGQGIMRFLACYEEILK